MQLGAFTNPHPAIRQQAIEMTKQACDWALALGANEVVVWSAFDGYDYALQVNYDHLWDNVVTAFQEICDAYPTVKVCRGVEPTDETPNPYTLLTHTHIAIHPLNPPCPINTLSSQCTLLIHPINILSSRCTLLLQSLDTTLLSPPQSDYRCPWSTSPPMKTPGSLLSPGERRTHSLYTHLNTHTILTYTLSTHYHTLPTHTLSTNTPSLNTLL